MAREEKRDRFGFGLTLIFIGVIWILFKLNILTFSVFAAISNLWPLLLVVAGVNMIFRGSRLVHLFMWSLFLVILIWYGQFGYQNFDNPFGFHFEDNRINYDSSWTEHASDSNSIKVDDRILAGDIGVNLGFGDLTIVASGDETLAFSVPHDATRVHSRIVENHMDIDINNTKNQLLEWDDQNESRYDFKIPKNVQWDIDVNTGAIDGIFDLRSLEVRHLDIDCGAGDIEIIYGNSAPSVYTSIDSGATDIRLIAQKNSGVEIKLQGFMDKDNIDDGTLERINDNIYRTPDFENQSIKLFIDISTGVGDVSLDWE